MPGSVNSVPADRAEVPTALEDRLTDWGYAIGWSVICRMPEAWASALFRFLADVSWRRQGRRVQVLEANLRRVTGPEVTGRELRQLSRESMRSYARYWLEVFRLPVVPRDQIATGVHEHGHLAVAQEYMAAGRGVVLALPHMGNWDRAGAWFIAKGAGSFTAVMERLKPESVYDRFVAFREGLGMEVLPASGGASPYRILTERLRAGKMICLVCDRDVTGSGTGVEVEFFAEKARMMGGAAALALQTGAALMPVTLWFEGDGWGIDVGAEIPPPPDGSKKERIAAMTQQVASFFEAGIRAHPQDWHMLQRVFSADTSGAAEPLAARTQ